MNRRLIMFMNIKNKIINIDNINNYKKMDIQNIILDLDETLISSIEPEIFQKYKDTLIHKEHFVFENSYYIFPRPGVQEFLDFVFQNYNVTVWTAASLEYALFIIENIITNKPNRKLDYVFFNNHCGMSREKYNNDKQLKQLWEVFKLNQFNENNTVIVDDRTDLKLNQENNVVNCIPYFVYDESTDDGLKQVQDIILKKNKL